jgi:glycosyltransferase involved in cell wall biosynthesis
MVKDRKHKMTKYSMEIAIPAYNEEKNIKIVVEKSLSWLKKQTRDYRVSVLDDGSTDSTGAILDKMKNKDKHLNVIHHKKNLGIGMAWYHLYKHASKDLVLTCPADQQFDPADFSRAMPYVDKADIVSIYRTEKKDYTSFRKLLSNTNKFLIRILFGLRINDINWVKIYKKPILEIDIKLRSSLLENEILAKARKKGARIIQIPAPSHPRIHGKPKGANMKNLYRVSLELVKLFFITHKFK